MLINFSIFQRIFILKIPKHIGLIPDGNRRGTIEQGLQKHEGYSYGLNPGLEILRLAKEYGIKEITYYGFTTDNCKRPIKQVKAFATACVDAVNLITTEGVSLLVTGDTNSSYFPNELLKYTTRTDVNGGGIKINFLVNYGWEWDLSNINCKSSSRKQIHESLHSKEISRIDLILRWGGMKRLSGFLPVQSVYADFYTINHLWPDFKKEDFDNAMKWYDRQDVTLGG